MTKKVKELLYTDLIKICDKYYHLSDTCEGCPLKVQPAHCVKGLVDRENRLRLNLADINNLLNECMEMEIEVDE